MLCLGDDSRKHGREAVEKWDREGSHKGEIIQQVSIMGNCGLILLEVLWKYMTQVSCHLRDEGALVLCEL